MLREVYGTTVQTIVFSGRIIRIGSTFTSAVTVPAVMVCFVGLGYIMLSSDSHERLGFLNAILLTEIMFLVILSSILPASRTAPVVSRLILTISIILSVITCTTVVLVYTKTIFIQRMETQERMNLPNLNVALFTEEQFQLNDNGDSSEERVWTARRDLKRIFRKIDLAIFGVFTAGLCIAVIHDVSLMSSG